MESPSALEELEVEAPLVRAARLIFLGSLLFWPLFLFAAKFMLGAPGKSTAAGVERHILLDGTWLYPLAVLMAWFLAKRGVRQGRADIVCLLPWLLPALLFGYWVVYFFL